MKLFVVLVIMLTNLFSTSLTAIISDKLERDTTVKKKLLEYEQKINSLRVAKENYCIMLNLDLKQLNEEQNRDLIMDSIKNYKMQAFIAANSYLKSADKVVFEVKNRYIQLLTQKEILSNCIENHKNAKAIYKQSKKDYKNKHITLSTLKNAKENLSISETNLEKQKALVDGLIKKYKKSVNDRIDIKKIKGIDTNYHLPQKYEEIYKFITTDKIASLYTCEDMNSLPNDDTTQNSLLVSSLELDVDVNESNVTHQKLTENTQDSHFGFYTFFSAASFLFGTVIMLGLYRKKGSILDQYINQIKSKIFTKINFLNKLSYEKELKLALVHNNKNHLLYDISHELSMPLLKIVELSSKLKSTLQTTNEKELVEKLEYKIVNLENIIEDIVHRSELYVEESELENSNFNIYNKLEFIVETYASRADNKKIEVAVDVDLDLPEVVVGDGIKLAQILGHFISNAIKFSSPNGNVNLKAKRVREDQESINILFSVADNGTGMSEEQLEEIYDKFKKIDSSSYTGFTKEGWGLIISYISIRLLNGELKIETNEETGSTFSFELKFKKDLSIENNYLDYPQYNNLKVGVVLPHIAVKRDVDKTLMTYMKSFGTKCSFIYYDDIFSAKRNPKLPDILFIDQKYTKKPNEMDKILNLKSTIVFLTSKSLKRALDIEKYPHIHSATKPITITKLIRLFENDNINRKVPLLIESDVKSIILYSEVKLQCSIYSSVFKKLGYNTQLAKDKDDFVNNFGNFHYAVFDNRCFNEYSCSIASLARKLNTIPIILASKESIVMDCTEMIYNGTNSEIIQERLEGAK